METSEGGALFDANKINLIYEEKEMLQPDLLAAVKKTLNNFGNSIPHHEIKNFGDNIEIMSIYERPCYRIILDTEFEHRQAKEKFRKYQNEGTLEGTVNINNINLWDYNLEIPKGFQHSWAKDYTIVDSEKVVTCYDCKGRCLERCGKCGGNKRISCPRCGGNRQIKCPRCYGRWYWKCDTCMGRGLDGNRQCSSCHGTGSKTCGHCHMGFVPCDECCGYGDITCPACEGKGIIPCSTCNGSGVLIKYISLHHAVVTENETAFIPNKRIPEDLLKNRKIYYYKTQPAAIDKIEGDVTVEFVAEYIPVSIFDNLAYEAVKNKIGELLEASKESRWERETKKELASKSIAIRHESRRLKQRIKVLKINAISLDYNYNGRPYSLWIYGKDCTIFATQSPFSEIAHSYLTKAQELFKARKAIEALNELKKCQEMMPQMEEPKALGSEIKGIIQGQCVVGGICGGTLGVILGGFVIGFVPSITVGVIAVIIIGAIYSALLATKIKSGKKRFFYPLLASFSTVIFLVLCIFVVGFQESTEIARQEATKQEQVTVSPQSGQNSREYYQSGQLKYEGQYKNNLRAGLCIQEATQNSREYYQSGQLKYEGQYKNNLRAGLWKYYHENGVLASEGVYKGGEREGAWNYFYENGKPRCEEFYKNGKEDGIWKYYYESGQLREILPYKDGKLDGLGKIYYETGQLRVESQYKDNKAEGVWKFYHENGQLKEEAIYKNGKQEGIAKVYDEMGKLIDEVVYHGGKAISNIQ